MKALTQKDLSALASLIRWATHRQVVILHGLYLDIMRGDKLINCVMIKNGSAYAIDIISGFAMKYYPTEISCWKWKILI